MTKERLWSIRSVDRNKTPYPLRMVKEEDLGDTLLKMLLNEQVYDIGIKGVFVG